MTLHELESPAALQTFLSSHTNAVICFSATWCGPCKRSKPDLEAMASQYAADVTKNVVFGIVYEHVLGDAIHSYAVKAFPTYILFQNGREVQRVQGVNMDGIRSMIDAAGCGADLTGGETLGGGATPLSPAEARAQRLAKLGATTAAPANAPAKEETKEVKPPVEDVEMKTEEKENDDDVEMKDAPVEPSGGEDPTANLDKALLQTLTESMGFPLVRAQKGLLHGNAQTIDGAVDWIMQHQDDDDIDEPIPLGPVVKAQSYKCNECGKIMSNIANLETHANKTGHADFEESTQAVKPLTAEEKATKVKEIKALLATKRAQREELEKEEEKEREKQRRSMGKEMSKTREQMDMEQRKRDAKQRKREKDAARRERERIRAELAKDKAERRANKGKLQSTLGVEGYNPSAIQYDTGAGGGEEQAADHEEHHHKKIQASSAKIDEYIKKVSQYRAGGDGGKCLKILAVYVSNVVDNPDEEKFRTINMENKAFRTKVKPFIGGKHLLVAVGFKENEGGTALVLKEDADPKLLADTKDKLKSALESY